MGYDFRQRSSIRKFLLRNKVIIFLSFLFFGLRLFRITTIPIFNDEAIYLDWGWRELHRPNNLFYSLYDAKPPLLMWLFGLATIFLRNPLVAGRFVSVCFGYLTMVGVWKLAKRVGTEVTAIFSVLLYITIPLFSFFDRQALMESAIGAIGIWGCYVTYRLVESKKLAWAILLGVTYGLGYLIKTNALIFITACTILLLRKKLFVRVFIVLIVIFILISPMLVQQEFWRTVTTNARYALTLKEIILFPLRTWVSTLGATIEIIFIHLTPIVGILLYFSVFRILLHKQKKMFLITLWFLWAVILDIIFARGMIERYIVSFLPITTIFVGYFLVQIRERLLRLTLIVLTIGIAFFVTLLQLTNPLIYFSLLSHVSRFSLNEYTKGITSGYGVQEAVQFLRKTINGRPAFVSIALHTGNPESGATVMIMKDPNVSVGYLEASYIKDISSVDCLIFNMPLYFISREDDQAGLNKFLQKIYFARNPVNHLGIGIYTLKKSCVGKTIHLYPEQT